MREGALKHLCCPNCKGSDLGLDPLAVRKEDYEILEGRLLCNGCTQSYSVENGIPRLLKTEDLGEEKEKVKRLMDKIAPIHETKIWAPLLWQLNAGIIAPSYWKMAEIVAESTQVKDGGSALDVGTGTGITARKVSRLVGGYGDVVGVDISFEVLREAVRRTRREGLTNIAYVQGDAEELPFNDESFDAVTCTLAFHAIPSPGSSLEEMSRVLRHDGKICMTTAHIPGWLLERLKRYSKERHVHHRHFETEQLKEMFKQNGFQWVRSRAYRIFLMVEATKEQENGDGDHSSSPWGASRDEQ